MTLTLKVLVPDTSRLTPEAFRKPFILYRRAGRQSEIISVSAVPSILDCMGVSSGGGPPGFGYLEPDEVSDDLGWQFIVGVLPGGGFRALTLTGDRSFLGCVVSGGFLVHYFAVELPGTSLLTASLLEQHLQESGYQAVPLIEYQTPEFLLGATA